VIEVSIMLLFGAAAMMIIATRHTSKKKTRSTSLDATNKAIDVKLLAASIQKHQFEKKDLKRTFWKFERQPARKLALTFLFFGVISLISSVVFASYILAFLGLGLTFWGALFFFIRPVTYVKSSLLDSTIMPLLLALDRVLTQLNYQGNAIYLPPRSLNESQEGTLFIAAEKKSEMPAIEDISKGKVFMNPHGMCLVPLGQGLVNLFEKELGINMFKTDFNYLQNNLPRLFIEDLELVEDFKMDVKGDVVHVRMKGSVYSDVCSEVSRLTNICSRVGCPLCSAIAYALAKATGKAVTIEKNEFHENETIETWYRLSNVS